MDWNNSTRLRQDICTQTLEEKQSKGSAKYKLGTPGFNWCESQETYSNNMSELTHYQKVYTNACNVGIENELRYADLSNKRYIQQLFTRPYKGAYIGAGQNTDEHKDLETKLFTGLDTRSYARRACDVLSEVSINRFECLPSYGNPQRVKHIVPIWVRGGEHTRDMVRRIDYKRRLENMKTDKIVNKRH